MTSIATTSIVSVGGKGATLSAYAVYSVACGLAKVQIDDSALEKLSSALSVEATPISPSFSPTFFLTLEKSRAALLVILNKLVLADSRGVRGLIPLLIVETLNGNSEAERLDFGSATGFLTSLCSINGKETVGATKDEVFVIDNSFGAANGICGIVDCLASALSTILDAVAALSCEAMKADVGAFDSYVSGDGFSVKDETDVAGDMKMLLFGSKLTGLVESRYSTEIPTVNGGLREAVRLLHGRSRIELNSIIKSRKTSVSGISGKENALVRLVSHLEIAVSFAGESCLGRIGLLISSVSNLDLRLKMVLALQNGGCSKFDSSRDGIGSTTENIDLTTLIDSFRNIFKLDPSNYSLRSAYDMLVKLREVLAWEAAISLFVLEMDGSIETPQSSSLPSSGSNSLNVKSDRKNDKKKKKTLGKGTSIVRQLLRDRLAVENEKLEVAALAHWVQELFSYFDPKDAEIYALSDKVKEIVRSNEVRRLPKIPKGTRDFGKEQMAIRERAFSVILGIFKRHGAVGLDTPVFELRETLMGKYGEDSKLIYDLADQGGEICSLRYDLTVPFARYLAMNNITSLKRYQIGKVYRRDNPSKGRYREFYQCDFDIAGQHGKMEPDFEVIKVLTELLNELEIGEYEVKLNHRKLLDGMLEICGVPSEKFRIVCSSIDKLDKLAFDQVKKELVDEKGLSIEVAEKIGSFVKKRGPAFDILSELIGDESLFSQNKESIIALEEMEVLFHALKKANALDKVVFDLSLARGLDYYTGVIFEAVMKGSNQVGSIAAGGRYDNLVGMFSGKQVPAVGISLGIERVFTIMEGLNQNGGREIRSTETQVLVAVLGQDLAVAAELVAQMWNAKIPAEFGVHKNVMKHIKRAVDGGIPYLVISGESEQALGIVKLKDIKANKEDVIKRDDIVAELELRLNATSGYSCQRYVIV